MPFNSPYSLHVDALACERGDRQLFENISFKLNNSEGLHIAGANGSGKTTMLRIIAGLNAQHNGSVEWNSQNIFSHWQDYAQHSCYIGHHAGVHKALTARENCAFFVGTRGIKPSDQAINTALETLELYGFEDEFAGTLSAGQQRRIALAQLVLANAPLWILDEPYTALDKLGITILDQLCQQHLDNNGLLIFASHQSSALDTRSDVKQILLTN